MSTETRDSGVAGARAGLARRIVRRLKRTLRPGQPARFPLRLSPRPQNHLEMLGEADGIARYRMTGNDPQFVLTVPSGQYLPRGRYRLKFAGLQGVETFLQPLIYVEGEDKGWRKIGPELCQVDDDHVAEIELRAPTRWLRFDPSHRPGRIRIGEVVVEPIPGPPLTTRILLGLWALVAGSLPGRIVLRLARRWLPARAPELPIELEAEPVSGLSKVAEGPDAATYQITGPDPYFIIRLPDRTSLPPGCYRLEFLIPGGVASLIRPLLYVDLGGGFTEHMVVQPRFHRGPDSWYSVDLDVNQRVWMLRFDPSDRPGPLKIGAIRIRAIPRSELRHPDLAVPGPPRRSAMGHRTSPPPGPAAAIRRRLSSSLPGRLWRRVARRWLPARAPELPVELEATPISDLATVAEGIASTEYRMIGGDPYFHFRFADGAALPPGSYRLEFFFPAGLGALVRPRLYVDYGNGFTEKGVLEPHFHALPNGRHAVDLILQRRIWGLRFDPSDRPGRLEIGPLEIHSVPRSEIRHPERALPGPASYGRSEYASWISLYDSVDETDAALMRSRLEHFRERPLISIIMPTYNTAEPLLRAAIDSVRAQVYEEWELCIADDASPDPRVQEILREYEALDPRIRVVYRTENGHISKASNSALEIARGEWLALLDHDDLLAPHALFCVAEAIDRHPEATLFYSDEDKVDDEGVRADPYFKPDWNIELFRSHNLITHLGVYRRDLVEALGGFREGLEGAQDYDLALRYVERIAPSQIVHIPHILYHWRVTAGSTAMANTEKPYAMVAGERALGEHLKRAGLPATAELKYFGYRVKYELPDPAPLVTLIIPTRNGLHLLETCIESIRDATDYSPYEILVIDNGSDDPECLEYLEESERDGHIRVLRDDRPFNYSALNNAGVRAAAGDVIGFINNDIEAISADWLREMVSFAVQPGIGAVGARLLYPDDTLQHGGVVMGLGGLAAHAHHHLPRESAGYVGRAALVQNFMAVTAACLVVRKDHFLAVGGFDEKELAVAYNDVDLCLKLAAMGLRNVWTPYAELYHHESATRGYETSPEKMARFEREKEVMRRRWGDVIAHDPAYNPNLTVDDADFSLAYPPRVPKPWRRGG